MKLVVTLLLIVSGEHTISNKVNFCFHRDLFLVEYFLIQRLLMFVIYNFTARQPIWPPRQENVTNLTAESYCFILTKHLHFVYRLICIKLPYDFDWSLVSVSSRAYCWLVELLNVLNQWHPGNKENKLFKYLHTYRIIPMYSYSWIILRFPVQYCKQGIYCQAPMSILLTIFNWTYLNIPALIFRFVELVHSIMNARIFRVSTCWTLTFSYITKTSI